MVNNQLGLICNLNPVTNDVYDVLMADDSWEFFRGPNRELNKAHHMNWHFTAGAVTNHMGGASQLLNEPHPERPLE